MKIDANSAQIKAPNKVNTPEINQTAITPSIECTLPVISEGCTNIAAPIIVPTTNAVACGSFISFLKLFIVLVFDFHPFRYNLKLVKFFKYSFANAHA